MGWERVRTIISGRFVAATTMTCPISSIPSISFNKLVKIPSPTPLLWPSPLEEANESISSCQWRVNHPFTPVVLDMGLTKNTIDGDAARALRKTSRSARSDSPTNLLRSCHSNIGESQVEVDTRLHLLLGP